MRAQELEVLFEPEMIYMQTRAIVWATSWAFRYSVVAEKDYSFAIAPGGKPCDAGKVQQGKESFLHSMLPNAE